MSLKEYAPVPIEDERDDESEEFSVSFSHSTIKRRGSSTFLRRSVYFVLAQILIVVITSVVSVALFRRYRTTSCAGGGLDSNSAFIITIG
jgi:hypothetical protein